MVTGDGANLSQGQRQLLAIARAAVADPPVMILDEATSSIDTRTERHIEQGHGRPDGGPHRVCHRPPAVHGPQLQLPSWSSSTARSMEKGDHQELLDQKGRYYQLYTGQFQLS